MNWKNRIICMVLSVMILLFAPVQESKIYAAEQNTLPSGMEKEELEQQINQFVAEHEDTTAGMAVAVFDGTDEILKNKPEFSLLIQLHDTYPDQKFCCSPHSKTESECTKILFSLSAWSKCIKPRYMLVTESRKLSCYTEYDTIDYIWIDN